MVTPAGEFSVDLPLGIRNSKVIFDWIHEQKPGLFNCIVCMILIDSSGSQSYFYSPSRPDDQETEEDFNKRRTEHINTYFNRFRGKSDVHTLMNMWNFIIKGQQFGQQDQWELNKDYVKKLCIENSLNNKLMKDTLSTIKKCIKIIKNAGFKVDVYSGIEGVDVDQFINDLTPIIRDVYYDSIAKSDGRMWVKNGMKYKPDRNALNRLDPKIDTKIAAIVKMQSSPNMSYVSVSLNIPDTQSEKEKKVQKKVGISLDDLNALIS